MSSNEKHSSLRLKFPEGKKRRGRGVSLGCDFLFRAARPGYLLKHAGCFKRHLVECWGSFTTGNCSGRVLNPRGWGVLVCIFLPSPSPDSWHTSFHAGPGAGSAGTGSACSGEGQSCPTAPELNYKPTKEMACCLGSLRSLLLVIGKCR